MTDVQTLEKQSVIAKWQLTADESRPLLVFAIAVFLTIFLAAYINRDVMPEGALVKVILSTVGSLGLFAFFRRLTGSVLLAALTLPLVFLFVPFVPVSVYLLYVLAFIGLGFINPLIRPTLNDTLVVTLLIIIAFETEFLNGFFFEGLLSAGLENKDTLFHSAIAASYAHYLMPSIAIDGLLPVQYHVLSHRIFGGFSIFSKLSVLEVYSYSFTALAPSVLVFAMAGFAKAIQPSLEFGLLTKRVAAILLLILLAFIFKRAAFSHSILASESFLTAFVFSLLSFTSLFLWINRGKGQTNILLLAFAFLCLGGMSKASLAVLDLAVFGFFGLFFARKLTFWFLILASVCILYYALSGAAGANSSATLFDPLKFIDIYSMSPKTDTLFTKTLLFLILHFLAVWLCVLAGAYLEGWNYVRSKEFGLLFALTGPSLLIAVFLNFPSGANAYFSMVPMIVALCFLVTRWPTTQGRIFNIRNISLSSNQIASFVFVLILLQVFRTHGHFYPQMLETIEKSKDPQFASYVQQIRDFKATLPVEAEVKFENFDVLTGKIGCVAFFLAPALLEHPISGGVPTEADCPGLEGGYGLAAYQDPKTLATSRHFPIRTLRLVP